MVSTELVETQTHFKYVLFQCLTKVLYQNYAKLSAKKMVEYLELLKVMHEDEDEPMLTALHRIVGSHFQPIILDMFKEMYTHFHATPSGSLCAS